MPKPSTAHITLDSAVSKIIPKPTKRDVVKAAATALHNKRFAAWEKQKAAVDALEAKAMQQAIKAARSYLKTAKADYGSWREPGRYDITITVPVVVVSGHKQWRDALKALPSKPDFDFIHHELQVKAAQTAPGVDSLLNDPVLAEHLAKAAEAMLAKPNNDGKTINV